MLLWLYTGAYSEIVIFFIEIWGEKGYPSQELISFDSFVNCTVVILVNVAIFLLFLDF